MQVQQTFNLAIDLTIAVKVLGMFHYTLIPSHSIQVDIERLLFRAVCIDVCTFIINCFFVFFFYCVSLVFGDPLNSDLVRSMGIRHGPLCLLLILFLLFFFHDL